MNKSEEYNPICYHPKKDVANRATRVMLKDSFPTLNYGLFPRTWYGYSTYYSGLHVQTLRP